MSWGCTSKLNHFTYSELNEPNKLLKESLISSFP